jgi:putative nucleotidyltransferase with HDIG domain
MTTVIDTNSALAFAMVKLAFCIERVTQTNQDSILSYLNILKNRDEATCLHVIRVGLLARRVARHVSIYEGITPKMMLWAGLLHDVGKALIDPDILRKTQNFTAEDMVNMEPHVQLGWQLLERVHEYSANIIVRHHQFGSKPYPKELPALPSHLEPKRAMIDRAARILSLVDYYDAVTTRNNDKFSSPLSVEERRSKFIEDNLDQRELILRLEREGVFVF